MVKINQAYRIDDYVQGISHLSRLKSRLFQIRQFESWGQQPVQTVYLCFAGQEESSSQYEQLIAQQKAALRLMENTIQDRFTGVCFVTYQHDEDAKSAKRKLGKPKPMKSWLGCFLAFLPCLIRGSGKRFQGKLIRVKRAPDPSDIIWENLGVERWKVVMRRLFTAFIAGLVLCIGGGVVYCSSLIKAEVSSAYDSLSDPSLSQTFIYNLLSFLPSTLVALMNSILTSVIWSCERFSLYPTITDMQATVTRNLTLAMFINTALIAIPVHLNDWYGPHGLVVEVYSIMIANAVLPPVFNLISIKGIWRYVKRKRARNMGEKCTWTQLEANLMSERPEMNMPNQCSGLMKTYLLSVMYAPVLPVGLLIGVVAVGVQYWVTKYMLLRRCSRPVRLSEELDEVMLRMVALGAAAYAGTMLYFFYDLEEDLFIPGTVACGLVVVYLCTPIQRMLKLCLRKQLIVTTVSSLSETPKTYEDSAIDFPLDYDRANPATSTEGTQWWIQLITRKQGQQAASRVHTQSNPIKMYAKRKNTQSQAQKRLFQQKTTDFSSIPSQLLITTSSHDPKSPEKTEKSLEKDVELTAEASTTLVPRLNLQRSHLRYRSELYHKSPTRDKARNL